MEIVANVLVLSLRENITFNSLMLPLLLFIVVASVVVVFDFVSFTKTFFLADTNVLKIISLLYLHTIYIQFTYTYKQMVNCERHVTMHPSELIFFVNS